MTATQNKEYIKLVSSLKSKHIKNLVPHKHNELMFRVYKELVEMFYERNNRYPTTIDFCHKNLLPSARAIQRNHGGVKTFRKKMGHNVTDYSSGFERTEKIKKIGARAKHYEQELYVKLYKKYHKPDKGIVVNRETVISHGNPENDIYGYRRADVSIQDFNKKERAIKFIDFFYASTPHSFYGCVNIKNKKIAGIVDHKDVIFVSVNPEFTRQMIKKITLPPSSPKVYSYEEFTKKFLD